MVQHIKKELKTLRGKIVFAVSILFFVCVALFSMGTLSQAKSIDKKARVIAVDIDDMVFSSNNPDLYVSPGETVRFVVTNLDPGMVHDFKILGTDIQTRDLKFGEQDTVTFQAPRFEFDLTYICTWHVLTMKGQLLVRTEIPASSIIALK